MKETEETNPRKGKKRGFAERFGGTPVLLLALAGILLLLFGGGLTDLPGKQSAAKEEPAAYRLSLERELASLCAEVKGVGRVTVMITLAEGERTTYSGSKVASVTPPAVLGAAIVCDGGGDEKIRADLTRLVSALLGIGANRVTVTERRP